MCCLRKWKGGEASVQGSMANFEESKKIGNCILLICTKF